MIDFYHFRGTGEEISERMNELSNLGVKTISMTTYTLIEKLEMLEKVGANIVPNFERHQIPEAFKVNG